MEIPRHNSAIHLSRIRNKTKAVSFFVFIDAHAWILLCNSVVYMASVNILALVAQQNNV